MPTATPRRNRISELLERRQILFYLVGIAAGVSVGLLVPTTAVQLKVGINPAIGVLLYLTFLGVPFTSLSRGFTDRRFLVSLMLVNFVLVPLVVFGLSRFVADQTGLLIGVLLVLLTPCIDYVIVFSALAGAAHEKLLACTPLLMLLQLLLLPGYLYLMAGPESVDYIDPEPFVQALLGLVLIPLGLAALTQWAAHQLRWVAKFLAAAAAWMVPLMVVVLLIVVASQTPLVAASGSRLLAVVPIYVGFVFIMLGLGWVCSKAFGLEITTGRALLFSGLTRNSLVVLPLALALPASLSIAPAVVVTQTLVELILMVLLIKLVPRLLPQRTPR